MTDNSSETPETASPDQPAHSNKREIIEDPVAYAKERPYLILMLAVLAGATLFFGLGAVALLGPDEPRYAEVAREMFVSGDYVSPTLGNCLWFEKPALFYWLAAASYRLFGVSEFAARFPSALAATLTAVFIAYVLARRNMARIGLLSALVLVTSGLFIGYARAATPDMLLAASICVALLSGYAMSQSQDDAKRIRWLLLCAAATGLSVLAKGLVGVVLVTVILAAYMAICGKLRAVRWQPWALSLGTVLVVAGLWYTPVITEHGWVFIDQFFIDHHFRRYVSNRFYHPQPIYFYPAVAFLGTIPWSFFLPVAASRLLKLRPRESALDSLLVLAWVWVAVPVIFFSFSESKLPGYILPVFPALAIILGTEVERVWRGERARALSAGLWMTALAAVGIAVGFAIYSWQQGVAINRFNMLLLYVPLAVALASVVALVMSKRREFLLGSACVVATVVIGAATLLLPHMNDTWSLRSLSLRASLALRANEKIGFFIYKEYAPVFYAEGRVVCGHPEGDILNALSQDRLVKALEQETSMVVITLERWRDDLEDDGRFEMEYLGSQGEALAFRVWLK